MNKTNIWWELMMYELNLLSFLINVFANQRYLCCFFTERNWNMWIPGYGTTDDSRPFKKSATTEAHKQVTNTYTATPLQKNII